MSAPSGITLPVNYSISSIIRCILQDNHRARSLSAGGKQKRYDRCRAMAAQHPGLSRLLRISAIRSYPIQGAGNFMRVGILPPQLVIADQRFRDMCMLPFWTVYTDGAGAVYRHFGMCPGHGRLPCCPPAAPGTDAVQAQLDASDLFIVMQTGLLNQRWNTPWKFSVLHRLARDVRELLGQHAVTGLYGSGPCHACSTQDCLHSQPCACPELQTCSLESRGICVERICDDLAHLTGNSAWRLRWLKHFGLPQQTPRKWKYVQALSVKLP